MPDVVVVGGGIAGLGAARILDGHGLDVVVLEREDEAGGRMRSRQGFDGIWFDVGAEQLTSADEPFLEMIEEFGLSAEVIGYLSETGTAFNIRRHGRVHEFDMVRPAGILRYGAISPLGRARLGLLLPAMVGQALRNDGSTFESWRAAPVDDASMEEWLGRLAPEFLEYAMEPMWDIVCGYDPAEVSRGFLLYTMTAFHHATGFTLSRGLGSLTRALAQRLDVRTGTRVTRVDAATRAVEFEDDDGVAGRLRSAAVVVAVPGHLVGDLVDGLDEQRRSFFAGVRYQAHDNCFFRLSDDAAGERLGQLGFFPRCEHGAINQLGYGPVPTDPSRRVLRAGLKGRFSTAYAHRSDEELEAAIMARVAEYAPEIPGLVVDRFLCRWEAALPIFYPGYLRALADFHQLGPLAGVEFAGDYLTMPSTGGAHHAGARAAQRTLATLGGTS